MSRQGKKKKSLSTAEKLQGWAAEKLSSARLVNLLELSSLQQAMEQLRASGELTMKERSQYAVNVLQKLAGEKKIELKLRKKRGNLDDPRNL